MHHHERYDGAGYPHGLKGNDNSIYSQLCGLAIRFDRLFSKRKEINDVQFDFVINEIKIDRGAFSSEIIDILSKCRGEVLSYKDITKAYLQARAQEENLKSLLEEYTSVKEKMKNESMERMAIIYALSMEYYSLWLLDLKKNILVMRRNDNKFTDKVGSAPQCFSECINLYAEKMKQMLGDILK